MFKNSSSFSELAYFSALTALYITHSTRDPSDSLTLYFLHSDLFYSIEHNTASGELRVGGKSNIERSRSAFRTHK